MDAAVISIGDKIVGATGIFLQEQRIISFFYNRTFVELGSNYIDQFYRNNGLLEKLLLHRIETSKRNN